MISGWSKQTNKQAYTCTYTYNAVPLVSDSGFPQSVLTCNPTHRLSNKENTFCHDRKALSVFQLLSKYTDNCVKGTHNTARSKKGWQWINDLPPYGPLDGLIWESRCWNCLLLTLRHLLVVLLYPIVAAPPIYRPGSALSEGIGEKKNGIRPLLHSDQYDYSSNWTYCVWNNSHLIDECCRPLKGSCNPGKVVWCLFRHTSGCTSHSPT